MAGRARAVGWRLVAGGLPLVVVVATGPSAFAAGGPSPIAVKAAVNLVAARRAALARANAKVTAADLSLTRLETQAEVLTERYDQAMWAEQQAAAGYSVAANRLAVALRTQQADTRHLAEEAAADLESGGDQGAMTLMVTGPGGPGAYFDAVGLEEALGGNRVDMVAASQADGTVARLFKRQAMDLLAEKRADAAAADSLRIAIQAAVSRQVAQVRADESRRSSAAARLASAKAAVTALKAGREANRASRAAAADASAAAKAGAGAGAGVGGTGDSGAGVGGGNSGQAVSWAPGAGATAAQGVTAADWALTQLGKPYRWGGAGPGAYDCSGLTMGAWAKAGIKLAHWTGYQWLSGPHVPLDQLRPGDLVFYATNVEKPATIHHVGIYIGEGLMVDAPFTGADVRIDTIHQYPGLIGATRPAST